MPNLQSLVKRTHAIYKNHKPAVNIVRLLQAMIDLNDATDEAIVISIHRSGIQDKYSQFVFNLLLLCHSPDNLPTQMTIVEYSSSLLPSGASSALSEQDKQYIREVQLFIRHKKQKNEITRLTNLLHHTTHNLQLKEEEISQKNVTISTYETIIRYNESIEFLNKLGAAQEVEMKKIAPLKAELRDKIHSCAIATSFGNISLDETVSDAFQSDLEVSDANLKDADKALIERTGYIRYVSGLLSAVEAQFKLIENQVSVEVIKCNPIEVAEEKAQNKKIFAIESHYKILLKQVQMDLINLQKALSSTKELLQDLEQANNTVRDTIAELRKDLLSSYQLILKRMESRNSSKKSDTGERTISITTPDSDQEHANSVASIYSTSNSALLTRGDMLQSEQLVSTLVTHEIEPEAVQDSHLVAPTISVNRLVESSSSNSSTPTPKRRNHNKNNSQLGPELRAGQKNSSNHQYEVHHQHSHSTPQYVSDALMPSLSHNSNSSLPPSQISPLGLSTLQNRSTFYSPIPVAKNTGNFSPSDINNLHMRSGSDQQNYQRKNRGHSHPLHHSIGTPSATTSSESKQVATPRKL